MNEQLNNLQQWLQNNNIDAAYIHQPDDIAYFTGFASDPHERIMALFVFADDTPLLFVPALEEEGAKTSVPFTVASYLDSEQPFKKIKLALKQKQAIKTMALQKDVFPVERLEAMQTILPDVSFAYNVSPFIAKMKLFKTKEEKQWMMEAGDWADFAFAKGFEAIAEGVSEQEIVAYLEYELKKKGVSKMSFDTLVLAGAHAASPHGAPSANHFVQPHELVLFDLGCMWKGYASDATRMASFKEPTDFQKKIFDIVRTAQQKAQDAVKPGVTASELDFIARDYIERQGYGEYFTHRLGHGIGKQCHEAPSIVAGNDLIIEEGMCFSLEPGIYIPNEVGVRVEDCVYVTKNGCDAFTKSSKDLHIID